MKRFISFLLLQLKRVYKQLPTIMVVSVLVYAILGCVAFIFLSGKKAEEGPEKYRIGIVGDVSDTYLGFGINAIETLDDSRYLIDFEEMSEEEAKDRLAHQDINAYGKVPEGFVDALIYGSNDKYITYYRAEGQKGVTSILMDELTKVVSTIINTSQNTVYAMQTLLYEKHMEGSIREKEEELSLRLIGTVTKRTNLCDMEVLGVSQGLSFEGFYFGAIFLFLLFLFGITCCAFFTKRNRGLTRYMASRGVTVFMQVSGEFVAYFVMFFACAVLLFALMTIILPITGITIYELRNLDAEIWLGLVLRLLPVFLLISVLQYFIYECMDTVVSSVLCQVLCFVGMAFLSGYFFPESVMPKSIQTIGEILPTGVTLEYVGKLMKQEAVWVEVLIIILYSTFLFCLAVSMREYRFRKDTL